ncbi:MAG: hypothetical protein HQL00_07520 [Nitrospirae bacterium]|nr:hypothetical protein [Nitrospirota bacterium]
MSSELYLDLVSKTIISMLSKEIAADVGTQVGMRVNDLLNNTLAGLISEQVKNQTDKLGHTIVELEGTLKPQIGELGSRITAISEQIVEKLGLSGEIESVRTALTSSMDNLSRQMTNITDSTNDLVKKSNLDPLRQAVDELGTKTEATVKTLNAMSMDISAMNEARQGNLGTLIEGVSSKIEASFTGLDKRMAAIVETTAKLAGETNLDILKQVVDGIGKQAEQAAAASGAIKNDLAAINDMLQKNLGTQIEGVSSKIDASFTGMDKRMAAIVESTAKLAGETNLDILKQVVDGIGKQAEQAAAASGAIKNDLAAINDMLQKNLGTQIEGVSSKIDASFTGMDKRMAAIVESTAKLAGETNLDMLKQVMDGIDGIYRQAEEAAAASGAIKNDLAAMNEAIQRLGSDEERAQAIDSMTRRVGDSLKVMEKDIAAATEGSTNLIGSKLDEVEKSVRAAIEAKTHSEKSIMSAFNEDMALIKQAVQLRDKEEGEMVKGVYYSMKKLISDFNKERENAIVFNKQYLTSMNDLRTHIEEYIGKNIMDAKEQNATLKGDVQNVSKSMQQNVKDQNKMLLDIIMVIEKQLPFFSGKVDEALSGVENKIAGFERATLSKITNTSTDIMKYIDENVANSDTGRHYGPLMAELGAIKQLTNNTVKDQNDVLQGVFLSVKKLLNISAKERDTNQKVANDLISALDTLYAHIRRLEAENDELDVELLRLAGDDYFKNKFKQLETELHKTRSLAEKYQDEKRELEQKYLKLQHEWEETRQAGSD